ncbi:MAG TPA: DUF4123 domain-containing protein [Acetobacteraceae bacterium]|nr:DUF4123 domain-containing protein [Acetobacteraceae bacterium]
MRQDAAARQRAIQYLWGLDPPARERQAYLYGILDAARDEGIYPQLRRLAAREHIVGLYQGRAAAELAAVAPYLVCLGTSDRVFDWIWQRGWGKSWGIFLWSLVSIETLRAHFRRLTMVQTAEGKRLLFRFYDPRVLPVFLPTCDADQLRELFGPVQWFAVEDTDGGSLTRFRFAAGSLTTRQMTLTDVPDQTESPSA